VASAASSIPRCVVKSTRLSFASALIQALVAIIIVGVAAVLGSLDRDCGLPPHYCGLSTSGVESPASLTASVLAGCPIAGALIKGASWIARKDGHVCRPPECDSRQTSANTLRFPRRPGGRTRRQQLAEVVVSQKEIRRGDHEVAAPIRARDAGRRRSAVRVRAALTREMARGQGHCE
jgi:hypothetical protein